MTQSKQQVSIIIPHFNQKPQLLACLDGIRAQHRLNLADLEIVVVDDGSKDFELDNYTDLNIKLIKTLGFENPYICRNIGIQKAKYSYLAFIDATCVPSDDWLVSGLKALSKSQVDIVAGHFDVNYDLDDLHSVAYKIMYLDNENNIAKDGAVPGGNFFARKAVFDDIGVFNEAARSGGDIEWSMRARKLGKKITFEKSALVSYPGKYRNTFVKDVARFGKGARTQWMPLKGFIWVSLVALMNFSPLKPSLFNRRWKQGSYSLSFFSKMKVYLIIWYARIRYGLAMLGFK